MDTNDAARWQKVAKQVRFLNHFLLICSAACHAITFIAAFQLRRFPDDTSYDFFRDIIARNLYLCSVMGMVTLACYALSRVFAVGRIKHKLEQAMSSRSEA